MTPEEKEKRLKQKEIHRALLAQKMQPNPVEVAEVAKPRQRRTRKAK